MPADPAGVNRWSDELDRRVAREPRPLPAVREGRAVQLRPRCSGRTSSTIRRTSPTSCTNVTHLTAKPGVYVLVTLFADPTIKDNNGDFDSEWPSSLGDSNTRYTALAEAFVDNSHVLFGLTNEPHTDTDGARGRRSRPCTSNAIAAIRAVEDAHGVAHHIVVVQAPLGYARDVSYFVAHPLTGDQIAYEIHPYNHQADFAAPDHAAERERCR